MKKIFILLFTFSVIMPIAAMEDDESSWKTLLDPDPLAHQKTEEATNNEYQWMSYIDADPLAIHAKWEEKKDKPTQKITYHDTQVPGSIPMHVSLWTWFVTMENN